MMDPACGGGHATSGVSAKHRSNDRFFEAGPGVTSADMRIEIELEELKPPCGEVRGDSGPAVAFSGWLGLLRILERMIESRQPAAEDLGDELDP